jgi:hypothetical protein
MTYFRFAVDQADTHVHFRVFAGSHPENTGGLAGKLSLQTAEFLDLFQAVWDRQGVPPLSQSADRRAVLNLAELSSPEAALEFRRFAERIGG